LVRVVLHRGERERRMRDSKSYCALYGMETTSDRLLTAAEVAKRLGFTERYVWKLGREGVLPRVKLPGRKYVRFCEADVDRFVREGRRMADLKRPRVRRTAPLPSRF
jgi:excisionase family DNA binding protein